MVLIFMVHSLRIGIAPETSKEEILIFSKLWKKPKIKKTNGNQLDIRMVIRMQMLAFLGLLILKRDKEEPIKMLSNLRLLI